MLLVGAQVTYALYGKGVEFFPDVEPEFAQVLVHARGNLSIDEMDRLVQEVEDEVLEVSGIKTVYTRVGSQEEGGRELAEDVVGVIQIEFKDWTLRRPAAEIFAEIRSRTDRFAGVIVEATEPEVGPPTGKPVQLHFSSRIPEAIEPVLERVLEKVRTIDGLVDLEDTRATPGIEWQMTVDREQASRFGADIVHVGNVVKLVTNGLKVDEYRPDDADEEIDIRVRYPTDERTLNQLDTLRVTTEAGLIPISNFVVRKPRAKVGTINRTDSRRVLAIKADVTEGVLADDKVQEIKAWLDTQDFDPRVDIDFKGEDEEQKQAEAFLLKAFGIALFIMAIVLVTQFNSFYHAFLILSAVIMSTIGVMIGLMITGQAFGIVMTGVGVITLAGIVVNNNIVLIDTYDRLKEAGMPALEAVVRTGAQPSSPTKAVRGDPSIALERGTRALVSLQAPDGSWEGEVVWCPMLAAQYALMCHVTGTRVLEDRAEGLLRHFERTRLASGLWGLREHAEPSLFVTALVYVAARLLGVERTDSLLRPAADFITGEGGVTAIPSWGKFWLALLGLYEWAGVHPILPEAWVLPRRFPLHPGHFYCHTRMIYMGMAAIYGRKHHAQITPVIENIRSELYPQGYRNVNFRAARWQLRPDDLYKGPNTALKLIHRLASLVERFHNEQARRAIISSLEERMRWELQTSNHTSISPVSGLLNIIALWLADPADPDLKRALQRFEGWLWEDEGDGARVAGARSVSWDTAFAVQTLAATKNHAVVADSAEQGSGFLATQQIRQTFDGYRDADRIDPKGGWCFAGVWHGWPVSDCTAEAVLALAKAPGADRENMRDAARFILRCQNRDGGFGSYEPRRLRFGLEWLNPAEMFGGSMTEASWVECTASCLAALAEIRKRYPGLIDGEAVPATARAVRWLRRQQQADGAWPGTWGVHLIYGTMFGITGLLASGAPPVDPDVRRACAWLKARQRPDGGWGEHFTSCLRGEYVDHSESQVIQSAWALRALLAAEDPDWQAIDRGVRFLAAMQRADGTWPKQDMAGVFFNTALLDYELYRSYFPIWALALYETRRKARLPFAAPEIPRVWPAGLAFGA